MPKHRTFKDVLKKIMDDGYCGLGRDPKAVDLLNRLRDFFERWRDNNTDNHLWESIADGAERRGLSRERSYYRLAAIAFEALLIDGHPANAGNMSPKKLRARSDYELRLAECAEALANYYHTDEVFADEKLARSYSEEAKRFRLASDQTLEGLRWVSRQSHGKKFAREHLSFMRSLARSLQREVGRPYYEACAALTNIAYPRKKVATAEDVRLACRAKRGTGRLKSK